MGVSRDSVEIRADSEAVFDLIHDYPRRLTWDSFLREAKLCDGAARAAVGAKAYCAARWVVGGLAMETEYVTFKRPSVAAVRMTRGPALLASFAATIRQKQLAAGRCRVTYISRIRVRPRLLRPILEPVVRWVFTRETRRRLSSLRAYFDRVDSP
ncbi:MAG: SRPBCC family protein [Pirellulales bacterium]|nr:SRPBCC family protein [Planctomycetales bacterium]